MSELSVFRSGEKPLFRAEACSGSVTGQYGNVLVHQPAGYFFAAALAAFFIALVAMFMGLGSYTKVSRVMGLLMPEQGIFRLASNTSGSVAQVKVREGQMVEKGDVLFIISGERRSRKGDTQQLISSEIEQRLSLLQLDRTKVKERAEGQLQFYEIRLGIVADEVARLHEELFLLTQRVKLASQHVHRQQELVNANFISVAQLQVAEAEMLALQGQQQALRRTQANLQREQTALKAQRQDAEHRYQADILDVDSRMAVLKQEQAEQAAREEQIVLAPFKGVVTGLGVQPGQQVIAGALLASVIPHGVELAAHVYMSSRQAGFVEVGQVASVRYSAYPYQKFGSAPAKVISIAQSPYALQELPVHIASVLQAGQGSAELFYKVTLEVESQAMWVYGKRQSLQSGTLLEADIVQDKRRLYEWVLEPLYSVSGKLH